MRHDDDPPPRSGRVRPTTLRRRQQVLELLELGLSTDEIANRLEISPRSARRYVAALRQEMTQAEQDRLVGLASRAVRAAAAALATLQQTAVDPAAPAGARVQAALGLLTHYLKLVEASQLLSRLEALESELARLKEQKSCGVGFGISTGR